MISLDQETRIGKRFAGLLALVLIVGVEAAWLAALVAVAVWLLVLR
jgi:type IV secretory pathway TrbD component